MEHRPLGGTKLSVSVMGFGCGAVGGLMVRGSAADQERAVARAIELGISYFDTAPAYGDGASESNLGRVLARLRPNIALGTKFRVAGVPAAGIEAAIAASLEASLRRLGRDTVDLFQLHNPIAASGAGTLAPEVVIAHVLPALARLREQGKFGFAGFTAVGETAALHRVIAEGGAATAQVAYNLLNPSAGRAVGAGYPGQDYGDVLGRARGAGLGVIGIRVLAGGALSGSEERHPIAAERVVPIGSGADYRSDVRRAQAFVALAREAGLAGPTELAIRFAISHPAMSTAMVGLATLEQLELAGAAAERGPLPEALLGRIAAIEDGFVGEPR
jgi:aryl-alcohol dehydrogenase-like predicted oxidoreductase